VITNDPWIDLKEASRITGRSITALRLLINRRKIDNTKKIQNKGQGYWVIHQDALKDLTDHDKLSDLTYHPDISRAGDDKSEDMSQISQVISLAFEQLDKQRKEWDIERDKLLQGLMMYRYKFEDLDKKMKLLPAPVEVVADELKKSQQCIADAHKKINEERLAREQLASLVSEKEEILNAEVEFREKLSSVLGEKEEALINAQTILDDAQTTREKMEQAMTELRKKLEDEEKVSAELREAWEHTMADLKRPWWKKLFGVR